MFEVSAVSFTFSEGLAIAGIFQGLAIIVYLLFRVREWRQTLPALACFGVLTGCFIMQFALRLEPMLPELRLIMWLGWALVPILSYMLMLQIATVQHIGNVTRMPRPRPREALLAVLPFIILLVATYFPYESGACRRLLPPCDEYMEIIYWLGSMLGAVILGLLWLQRDFFNGLRKGPGGRERYWLVLTLIVVNIGIVVTMLIHAWGKIDQLEVDALLVIMGLAALYLASSSLFRVYPAVIDLAPPPKVLRLTEAAPLNPEEEALLLRVRDLIDVQKVYHEQSFGRGALARELGVSESQLSRVINHGYGKSLPRLLNERRVADAQRMLNDPAIPVQVVAFEVGFNSLASFNRVFKEVTGLTPTEHREEESVNKTTS